MCGFCNRMHSAFRFYRDMPITPDADFHCASPYADSGSE